MNAVRRTSQKVRIRTQNQWIDQQLAQSSEQERHAMMHLAQEVAQETQDPTEQAFYTNIIERILRMKRPNQKGNGHQG